MEVGNNGAAFLPLLLLLEVDHTVGDTEILAENPICSGCVRWVGWVGRWL